MTAISIAIFDVDGVLIDSLDAHLQICRDEAQAFGLDIEVPTVEEFRTLVAHGAVVSPMVELFRTVGFPGKLAELANEHYKKAFARKYPVRPFPGVPDMLAEVAATGMGLGIATSNTRANISSALGDAMRFFDARCIFADDDPRRVTKAEALSDCARNYGTSPEAMLYIGDQPRDFAAAQMARVPFLGVTYGWGIEADETRFAIAKSPEEIANYIRARTH
jgi:phosphoglycolate phosphatase-like HAD superfamily hydrolase